MGLEQDLNIVLGVLLIISEVMPYINKHKGNGIIDTIVCLLKGSSCATMRLANVIENNLEENLDDVAIPTKITVDSRKIPPTIMTV